MDTRERTLVGLTILWALAGALVVIATWQQSTIGDPGGANDTLVAVWVLGIVVGVLLSGSAWLDRRR